ncbi:MAG: hypothetical protein ACN6O3_18625 [Comamonas sp.]
MLQRLESGLLFLARIVMIALVLLTLAGLVAWLVAELPGKSDKADEAHAASTVQWSDVKIDDADLKRTTYSDFDYSFNDGNVDMAESYRKLAADAAAVQAFARVDALLRGAIERKPAARAALEETQYGSGLAPAQTLGQIVKAWEDDPGVPAVDASDDAASAAAAAASASEGSETHDAVSIGKELLERSYAVMEGHGYDAGRAFVLGAPAAFETLLADPRVQKGIDRQTASYVVNNLLMNYHMAFSSKASEARESSSGATTAWFHRLMEPSNLLILSILLWSFVLMMMVVVFLRIERYLRGMALPRAADRP